MSVPKKTADYLGRFELPSIDTPIQQIKDAKLNYIELRETHLIYHFAWDCAQRDDEESVIWTDYYQAVRQTVRRDRISNVSLYYHNANKCWRIDIDIDGSSGDIWLHYPQHKEAKEMFQHLEAWYLE